MADPATTAADTDKADTDKVERIRQELPATQQTVYLNAGTCGPLPRRAVAAMQEQQEEELLHGRIAPDHYPALSATVKEVKAAVAGVLHCDPTELALSRHTTDGMNIAIAGYPWQRGDEILTSNIEHPGGLYPIFLAKRRSGVRIRVADIGLGGGPTAKIVGAFERLITPRTRMIVVSHISYTTGAILPLEELVAMAHSHDVLVTVDAAQAYGQIPLDLHALGVDFYACPGQKWMCGPEGTGVFYARASSLGEIEQTFVGGFSAPFGPIDYYGGTLTPAAGSARFDVGSLNLPLLIGQKTATEWITNTDEVGLEWATTRIHYLGNYARQALSALDGVRVVTPQDRMAGLLSFTVEGIDPEDLATRLRDDHNITIRFVAQYINNPRAARIAVGFYNTEAEIDHLCAAIQTIQQSL
ncbi:MAG: aminotransferase class V-fold PLP-dependent enzyme [Ktedonobacterales bacterium]